MTKNYNEVSAAGYHPKFLILKLNMFFPVTVWLPLIRINRIDTWGLLEDIVREWCQRGLNKVFSPPSSIGSSALHWWAFNVVCGCYVDSRCERSIKGFYSRVCGGQSVHRMYSVLKIGHKTEGGFVYKVDGIESNERFYIQMILCLRNESDEKMIIVPPSFKCWQLQWCEIVGAVSTFLCILKSVCLFTSKRFFWCIIFSWLQFLQEPF